MNGLEQGNLSLSVIEGKIAGEKDYFRAGLSYLWAASLINNNAVEAYLYPDAASRPAWEQETNNSLEIVRGILQNLQEQRLISKLPLEKYDLIVTLLNQKTINSDDFDKKGLFLVPVPRCLDWSEPSNTIKLGKIYRAREAFCLPGDLESEWRREGLDEMMRIKFLTELEQHVFGAPISDFAS